MDYFIAAHALIERDGKYLVTLRSRENDYMPLKWDLPGGIVQPGETLEEALYREVVEETKLLINIHHVLHIYSNRNQLPIRQDFQAVYLCSFLSGNIELNPAEHEQYQWLDYPNISKLDTISFLSDLLTNYVPT
jgi:8-oxo-dGTP diphosphatase